MTKQAAAAWFKELMLCNGAPIWPKDPRWINDFEPTGVFTGDLERIPNEPAK